MSLSISIIPAFYCDTHSGTVLKLDQHSEPFDKIQMSATSNALQQEVHTPLGSTRKLKMQVFSKSQILECFNVNLLKHENRAVKAYIRSLNKNFIFFVYLH